MRPSFFFFNDTATTEIYTLSLHDALPILVVDSGLLLGVFAHPQFARVGLASGAKAPFLSSCEFIPVSDRKSTRLNSSHGYISYAVFCLKKNNAIYTTGLVTFFIAVSATSF